MHGSHVSAETYSLCLLCTLLFMHVSYVSAETYRRVHTVFWHLCMILTSVLRLTGVYILYSVGIYAWFECQC